MKKIVLIAAFAVLGIGSASASKFVFTTSCGTKHIVNTDDYINNDKMLEAMLKMEVDNCQNQKPVEKDKDTDIRDKP